MSKVAKIEQPAPPAKPATEADAIFAVIERAARDPAVDIDKMRELLAMRKQAATDANEQAFNNAMAAAQAEMRPVAADANNPQTRSKYASYFALDKAVRPIYTRHGFALSFDTEDGAPADHIRVVCYVTCAGFTRKYHINMPADGKGSKGGDVMTKTHAAGSAMTYGQRYLLKMIFNMAIGEDNDGNEIKGPAGPISDAERESLQQLIFSIAGEKSDHLVSRLIRFFRVANLSEIPAARVKEARAKAESVKAEYKAATLDDEYTTGGAR